MRRPIDAEQGSESYGEIHRFGVRAVCSCLEGKPI